MSVKKSASNWLYSHHPSLADSAPAKTISITSGKGGVGKTFISLKLARILADQGYKVLLIDCDVNLANTAIKLGLPVNQGLYQLLTSKKNFDEVVYKSGNFHLLPACNGNFDLFKKNLDWDKIIIDIIYSHEEHYNFILLDCPAGLIKKALLINAHSDYRFVVVTPDKSSITDSYSLIKILNRYYKVKENHLLINKISNQKQCEQIYKSMSNTIENFLSAKIKLLGQIPLFSQDVEQFDLERESFSSSKINHQFFNVLKNFPDKGSDLAFGN